MFRITFSRTGWLGLMVAMLAQEAFSATNLVRMGNFNFTPTNLVIRPGDSVIWTNTASTVSHDSTQGTPSNTNGLWTSPLLPFRGTFQFPFTNEGSYPYMCRRHVIDNIPPAGPIQTGTVIVTTMSLLPAVSILTPTNNAGFLNRASVSVTTSAEDLDGAIRQVQIFLGPNPMGTVTNPPFNFTVGPLFAGTHTLTARTIDSQGLAGTSAPVNIIVRPRTNTVTVTNFMFSPSSLPNATVGDRLVFTNRAGSHTVTGDLPAEPFCGTDLLAVGTSCSVVLGQAGTFPFHCNVHPLPTFNMTGVVVVAGAPLINITGPPGGALLPEPGNFTVTADATKSGGTVTNVDFYANGVLLGRDTTSPFSADASGLSAGNYLLTARAIDNSGYSGFASPVTVTVGTALQLLSPAIDGNNFQFDLTTTPGTTYVVERAPDLPPTWSPFQTNLATSGTLRVIQPLPVGVVTQQFYRAFIQP